MRRHTLKKRSAKSGGGHSSKLNLRGLLPRKQKRSVTTVRPSRHPVALNALRLRNQGFHHPTIINTRRRNAMLANAVARIVPKNATVAPGSLRTHAFRGHTRNNQSHLFAVTTHKP